VDEDAPDSTGDEPTRLTLAQRVLTALPNLERKRENKKERQDAASQGSRSASTAALKPEAVIAPGPDSGGSAGAEQARPAPSGTRQSKPVDPNDLTAKMSNEELAHAIKRIDDREQRYAFLAGPLGAALGIGLTIAAIHTNPAVGHKGHAAVSTIVFEGAARVVFAAGVVATAFTRRRSLVAFALLFMGSTILPLGILFWGLGLWMIWRVFRYQKILTQRGVSPQRSKVSQGPRAAAKGGAVDARERVRQREQARERRRGRQGVPAGPPASKRYTPPKPTRPKPPSS